MNKEKRRKTDLLYLRIAKVIAKESKCIRKKVGAVIVKDENIISFGWNGTARGRPNECEDENGNTKSDVIHAEQNAIFKLASTTGSAKGATLYLTMSPCSGCTAMIKQVGIVRVVYEEEYRDPSGINILRDEGIEVERIDEN